MPIIDRESDRGFDYFTTQEFEDRKREASLSEIASYMYEKYRSDMAKDERFAPFAKDFLWQSLKELIVFGVQAEEDYVLKEEDVVRFACVIEPLITEKEDRKEELERQLRYVMSDMADKRRKTDLSGWALEASYKKAVGEALFKLKVNMPLVSHAAEDEVENSSSAGARFFDPLSPGIVIVHEEALNAGKEICDLVKAAVEEGTILHAKAVKGLDCKEINQNSFFVRVDPRFHTASQVVMYLPEHPNKEKLAELVEAINQIGQKYGFPEVTPTSEAHVFGIVSLRKDYDDNGEYLPASADIPPEYLQAQEAIVADLFGKPSLQAAAR